MTPEQPTSQFRISSLDSSVYSDAEPGEETTGEAAVNPFDDAVAVCGSPPGTNPFTDEL